MRILLAGFKHESNNFNDTLTTLDDYKRRSLYYGDDILAKFRGTNTDAGGFIDVLDARPDVEIVPVIHGDANPGGYVTKETFDYFRNAIIDGYLKANAEKKIDGIALVLHGAMLPDFSEDGEGELIKALRKVTGPELPITASLDYHANLSKDMLENFTALFIARYYPHTDMYDRGSDAAKMLLDVIDGKARPVCAFRKLPLIVPHLDTSEEPLCSLISDMEAESERDGVYTATFVSGFSRANIALQGAAIYAITENSPELAEELTEKYYRRVMNSLEDFKLKLKDPVEAVRDAIAAPYITLIADAADNPGSGLMSDATEIYHELIRQGADRVATTLVWDPETVEQAFAAGPGATIHARIGGKSSEIVGAPIEADAYVRSIHDGYFRVKGPMCTGELRNCGRTAVVEAKGITFVLTTNRTQALDEEGFRAFGIEPRDYRIIVVKSAIHYRAAWKKWIPLEHIITVDMPNITSFDELKVPFTNVKRPIYPLDSADEVRRAAGFIKD